MPSEPTPPESDKHKFMIYLPVDAYERLRTIAFEERTSMNKLILAAIDAALAKREKRQSKTTKKGG